MRPKIQRLSIMALALLAGCGPGPTDSRGVGHGETLLRLAATGVVEAKPDRGSFSAGVETRAATAQAALAANSEAIAKIIATLERHGVARDDLKTETVELGRDDFRASRQVTATNRLTVTVRKLDDMGTLIAAANSAGANRIDGPNFLTAGANELQSRATEAALRIARQRATRYAKAAGLRVIRIVALNVTGAMEQPIERDMMVASDAMAAAPPPIRSGTDRFEATITADFALAP